MATIIKRDSQAEQRSGRSVRPAAFNFEEMAGRADEYLASVRKEAAKIVQQAHSDAEQVRRDAEAAGRAAAEQAIQRLLDEKIAGQMRTLRPALVAVAQQLADARGLWLEEWEVAAVHLASRIAERILRRELEHDPQVPIQLLRESLELAAGSAQITVYMNAHDLKNLGGEVESIVESLQNLAPAKIVADTAMSPGGCLVTTEFGEIDNRIESQLARLEQELTS